MSEQRQVYTTKQAADLLGVTLPTIVNWIKKGLLEAYKTPGGHRRITKRALNSFMGSNGYPAKDGNSVEPQIIEVLIFTKEKGLGELVTEWLELKLNVKTKIVESLFLAGVAIGNQAPAVIILDATNSQAQLNDTLRKIRSVNTCEKTGIILVSGPRGISPAPPGTTVLRQPLDLDQLMVKVKRIIKIATP